MCMNGILRPVRRVALKTRRKTCSHRWPKPTRKTRRKTRRKTKGIFERIFARFFGPLGKPKENGKIAPIWGARIFGDFQEFCRPHFGHKGNPNRREPRIARKKVGSGVRTQGSTQFSVSVSERVRCLVSRPQLWARAGPIYNLHLSPKIEICRTAVDRL